MLSRSSKHFVITRSHSVLHRTPLYYEKPKQSSINIKKMTVTDKIAVFIFYFKKKIFILKTQILPQEVPNG
jgi:hypothetical protein